VRPYDEQETDGKSHVNTGERDRWRQQSARNTPFLPPQEFLNRLLCVSCKGINDGVNQFKFFNSGVCCDDFLELRTDVCSFIIYQEKVTSGGKSIPKMELPPLHH